MQTKQFILATMLALPLVTGCSDSDSGDAEVHNPTPKEQWSKTMAGGDGTIFAYPDLYVNYWEYTWRTKENGNENIALFNFDG